MGAAGGVLPGGARAPGGRGGGRGPAPGGGAPPQRRPAGWVAPLGLQEQAPAGGGRLQGGGGRGGARRTSPVQGGAAVGHLGMGPERKQDKGHPEQVAHVKKSYQQKYPVMNKFQIRINAPR